MLKAFCLKYTSTRDRKRKAPGNISINPRLSLNPKQVENSRLLAARQGVNGMKPLRYLFACLLVICVTVLFFSLFNRGLLCELRIKNGNQEVAAKLACSDR